ncbi:hypothetical protein UFOVP726_47 [uncultured Caudovirales phage]|uniref:Uncharacterized protein n=1 Tax=uncultured Caudovirales phage TaxID=2100421 RepID=A0A6J5NKB4_9CAUD|nr:hypothetical protein UFOVP726_47 [uncultured Caudovirales phage]
MEADKVESHSAVAGQVERSVRPLALLLACLLFAGCGDGYNATKVRGAVAADHPGAEITNVPDSRFKFLVRKPDGSVLYVEYMGADLKATASAVMFNAR